MSTGMNSVELPFARATIDRDARTRHDPKMLEAAWKEPGARVLHVHGLLIPVTRGAGGPPKLYLDKPQGKFSELHPDSVSEGYLYLGRRAGAPVFGKILADEPGASTSEQEWVHPFSIARELSAEDRELLSVVTALARWHESAGFSPRDGKPTYATEGGWARLDEHGGEHFPRTDPAVIVLVEHEGRALLGSNVLWESGRFSILAGFVEAGESLEQAVAREVEEESGMRLADITYVASQPWPFPRSLMLGFRARLAPGQDPEALIPDTTEISELRWFTRAEIVSPPPGIILPQGASIARWLLEQWAAEGDHERV